MVSNHPAPSSPTAPLHTNRAHECVWHIRRISGMGYDIVLDALNYPGIAFAKGNRPKWISSAILATSALYVALCE